MQKLGHRLGAVPECLVDLPQGRPWQVRSEVSSPGDGHPPARFYLEDAIRLIEEQGQLGFWCHEVTTDVITASAGYARICGVATSVVHTRASMLAAIHPQDRPGQDDLTGLIDVGQPLRREFRICRPDGTIRWVSARIDVAVGDDGRPVRFIGVIVDITERREAQRAVQFTLERRAALLQAISALTWVADAQGRFSGGAAWCELTGMTWADSIDEGWLEAVHADDRERVRAAYRASASSNTVYNTDYRLRDRDGSYRWYNARSAPIRDASGAVREWLGVLLPIEVANRPSPAVQADCGGAVPSIGGEHIRGARGLLDWSLAQLAAASRVSVSTIKRMEDGSEGNTRPSKSEAVRRALEDEGVRFRVIDGETCISRCA